MWEISYTNITTTQRCGWHFQVVSAFPVYSLIILNYSFQWSKGAQENVLLTLRTDCLETMHDVLDYRGNLLQPKVIWQIIAVILKLISLKTNEDIKSVWVGLAQKTMVN